MRHRTLNPNTAREKFYDLLKEVNETHTLIEIIGDHSAVLISLDGWRAIQETLLLQQTGTLAAVKARKKDTSGFTVASDIKWEDL